MKKENSNKDNNTPFKQFNFKFNFYWIYGIIFALLIGYVGSNGNVLFLKEVPKYNLYQMTSPVT